MSKNHTRVRLWRRVYLKNGKPVGRAKPYVPFANLTQWEADIHLEDLRNVMRTLAKSTKLAIVRYRGDVATELTIERKRSIEIYFTEALE